MELPSSPNTAGKAQLDGLPDPSGSHRSRNLGYAQLSTCALLPSVRDPTLPKRQMPYLRDQLSAWGAHLPAPLQLLPDPR
ncbi:hypothetical protein NW836_04775 [Synechococcus sp. H60.4]